MIPVWFIKCRTGCTCCAHENHMRGPYSSYDEAQRRIAYFKSEDSLFWPVASQYAKRGVYTIYGTEAEQISDGRYIVDDKVYHGLRFVALQENGSVSDNDAEIFEYD